MTIIDLAGSEKHVSKPRVPEKEREKDKSKDK